MDLKYDLYITLRSPYCWILAPRLVGLGRNYKLSCRLRPVYPLAVREGAYDRDPLYYSYSMLDMHRVAQRFGAPLYWPRPDPVYQDPTSGAYQAEQPLIRRITALCVAAEEHGLGLEFYAQVSELMWSGKIDGWHKGNHLAQAASRAGLDFEEIESATVSNDGRYHLMVLDYEREQRAAGHHGAPLMVFNGEPFYGQDRFDDFRWRLIRRGLSYEDSLHLT